MGLVVERSPRAARTSTGPLAHGFYTTGQLFLEEYYTLARHRQGRHRHAAHGRQHPALHGDGGGRAEGDRSAPTASPARTPTSTTATRCSCSATTWPRPRRCSGRGCSTGSPARTRPQLRGRRPAARPRWPQRADVHLRRPARHQPRADERAAARADRPRLDRPGLHRRPHRRLRGAGRVVDELPAGRGRGDLRRPRRRPARRPPRSSAPAERLLSTVPPGLLPVEPGDRRRGRRSTTCTCCAA